MKKRFIYSGIAGLLALGIYLLIPGTHSGILQDNIKAIADDPVKIPCATGGTNCQFTVEITDEDESTETEEGEEGILTIKELKNAK